MDERVKSIVDILERLKAEDILVLNFEKKSSLCDRMVICTARSDKNGKAIADGIELKLKEFGEEKLGLEGYNEGNWILMDFGDILVHILLKETREYYKLEQVWSFAKEEFRA